MTSIEDSVSETRNVSEWSPLNKRENQLAYLAPTVHMRVDPTTVTSQELGLTRLHLERPFCEKYCNKSQRLQTFGKDSRFSEQAELLARKGYFEDVDNPGTLKCFWCQFSFRVETQDLKQLNTVHNEDCVFFSLYSAHVEGQSTRNHNVGAQYSMQLNCDEDSQWLVVDCGHLHDSSFDSFPECFMANSRVPGTLCCPCCEGIITTITRAYFSRASCRRDEP